MVDANSNVTINMPSALLEKIRVLAKADGRSISSYIAWVLSNLIDRGRVVDSLSVQPLPALVDHALEIARAASPPPVEQALEIARNVKDRPVRKSKSD
jgi:hypothetical protein